MTSSQKTSKKCGRIISSADEYGDEYKSWKDRGFRPNAWDICYVNHIFDYCEIGESGDGYELLNDGLDLEMEMIRRELKYGYKSKSYRRFESFKRNYYDLFEKILLKNGYEMYEVLHLFNNHFKQWYDLNFKSNKNTKRVEVINQFLETYQV